MGSGSGQPARVPSHPLYRRHPERVTLARRPHPGADERHPEAFFRPPSTSPSQVVGPQPGADTRAGAPLVAQVRFRSWAYGGKVRCEAPPRW
jgi:hypothetical protein